MDQPARAERELEAAYRNYVAALLCADAATAYELLAARCRAEFTQSEFATTSKAAPELYGELEIITVQAIGTHGIVVVTSPALDAKDQGAVQMPWLLEKGEWHSDWCGI